MGLGSFFFTYKRQAGDHIPPLIRTADLHNGSLSSVEVPKIVALNERVTEFGVTYTIAALTHPFSNILSLHEFGHTVMLANLTQKIQILNIFKPIVVVHQG